MPNRTLVQFKPLKIPEAYIDKVGLSVNVLDAALLQFANDLKSDFEATVVNWQTAKKPKFVVSYVIEGNKVYYKVYTSSLIYKFVSGGTRKHSEQPKGGKGMKLAIAKTSVSALPSFIKRSSKPRFVIVSKVKHPGIKKRDYPAQVMRKRRPEFSARMHAAIKAALRG